MAQVPWTYQDAVERLLDNFGELSADGRNERVAREAVINAYNSLPNFHRWHYYRRKHTFQSEANQTDGTIAYTHSTRTWTLTGATWDSSEPEQGVIQVGTDHWPMSEAGNGSTTVIGDPNNNPGADVASTAYEWYREAYPVHTTFRRAGTLTDNDEYGVLSYVSPNEAMVLNRARVGGTINRPELYTIRADDRDPSKLKIFLIPPPNSQKTYNFLEDTEGRPLTIQNYAPASVTASVVEPTTSVTFSGGTPAFTSKHIGAILRLSADGATAPTSLRGGLNVDNPYAEQKRIVAVPSLSEVTVDSNITTDYSNVLFTVSSPIDVEPGAMMEAFWSLCDYEFVKRGMGDMSRIRLLYNIFLQDLSIAMNADRRTLEVQPGTQRHGSFGDWLPVGSVDASID